MPKHVTELPYDRLGLKPALVGGLLGEHDGKLPWRVASVERGLCSLIGLGDAGESVTRRARPPEAPIAVGDWVVIADETEEPPRVGAVLERLTALRRGAAGDRSGAQLLAANLDTVFVVSAFAPTEKLQRRGLNARRMERYVSAVTEGGAQAVMVLNKVDLAAQSTDELRDLSAELTGRLGGLPVLCVSATERRGLEPLTEYLVPGDTVAFIGMSGVGKSSLINAVLGEERVAVAEVRQEDSKGRHTTTRRELVTTPTGALLIDTPGMREFAVFTEDGDVAGFDDIDEFAQGCRFPDCQHDTEPDCAVLAAVDRGELPRDRLQNFHSLQREAARQRTRHDAYARHLEHKEAKRFGRLVKQAKATKKR